MLILVGPRKMGATTTARTAGDTATADPMQVGPCANQHQDGSTTQIAQLLGEQGSLQSFVGNQGTAAIWTEMVTEEPVSEPRRLDIV